ncbi:AAA family ATPase [Candidatus Dojkabacteria bacterium]|uniref:AAA family ATPase n=1 Tax=Candidatus Dojkabacteria bacterium TaxID=2099670 RepID=A0A955L3M2_9BACT|nr:AAA family ATPase [Candidatus Dojkabacteria bacterium]
MNALSKLTVNAQKALIGSKNIAKMSGSEIIIPQHLFIAITNNKDSLASRLLANMGINLDATKENIKIPENKTSRTRRSIRLSSNLKTIIRDSYAISYELGHVYVGTEHLLLALLKARNLAFVKDLEDGGLDYDDVKGKLLSFANYPPGIFTKSDSKEDVSDSALGSFGKDLTSLAEQSSLLPIIGRDEEIDRIINILARRTKNNPILIGDAGVGKTAVVEGLAQRIVERKVPESIQKLRIISIDISSIIAGSKVRGELEEKVLDVINEVVRDKNTILFIDEIHVIAGASPTGSGADIANVLKPVLTDPYLKVIGATTYAEYKKTFDEDEALRRRFQPVMVEEVNIEDGIKILEGLKDQFEDYHNVKIYDDAIKDAVGLSSRYIAERYLPDKAIDVIDEAGAANLLLEPSKRKKKITSKEIEIVVSSIAKVPVRSVSQDDKKSLRDLASNLKKVVFGQDEAVDAISLAIKRSRANLKAEGKPVGCFLFAGPTGVGKTELAKALSAEMGVHFHRFDMSEYMEKHSVSRLIGAPPGYVGYDEGGLLTDMVRKNPYSVILFDEIEKAHEDIYNVLLQVMDDAMLTDSQGKKADFRNAILIMTTNAGSNSAASIGFGKQTREGNREKAIKKQFRPEFRNRLDDIVYFLPLPIEIIRMIVDKFVRELEGQLAERKVSFELTPEARDWLAEKGFDEELGARPMARLIQTEINNPLADEILFGSLSKGGKVTISIKDSKIHFDF